MKNLFFLLALIMSFHTSVSQTLSIDLTDVFERNQKETKKKLNELRKDLEKLSSIRPILEDTAQFKQLIRLMQFSVNALDKQIVENVSTVKEEVEQGKERINSLYDDLKSQNAQLSLAISNTINQTSDQLAKSVLKSLQEYLSKYEVLTDQLGDKEAEIRDLKTSEEMLSKKIEASNALIISDSLKMKALLTENNTLKAQLATSNSNYDKIKEVNESKSVSLGLSFGFNFGSSRYSYIVNNDQTVNELVESGGTGLISTLVIIRPNGIKNLNLLLNIPLAEIGIFNDSNSGSSNTFFNEELSLGLGLGYEFAKRASAILVINNRRIDRIDSTTLEQRNLAKSFTETPGTKLNLDSNSTISESDFTWTFGISWRL